MMTMTARSSSPAGRDRSEELPRAAEMPELIAQVEAVAGTFAKVELAELGGAALIRPRRSTPDGIGSAAHGRPLMGLGEPD